MLTLPVLDRHPGVSLVAACDPRPDALGRFEREFGGRGYAGLDQLLGDRSLEAVYIASPHQFHHAHAVGAARAGLHALVEKPMALTLEDCDAMVRAAGEAGTVLVVGPSHAFDASVTRASEAIATGVYGRVRLVTAMNYTDFVYRPRRAEELDPAAGGGVVFSQGAHQVDVVRRLVGSDVVGVRAALGDWDPERATEGAYAAFLTFANGAAANLTYSGYGRYDSDVLVGGVSELGQAKSATPSGATAMRDEAKLERAYGQLGRGDIGEIAASHEHFGWFLVSCERADLRLTPDAVHVHQRGIHHRPDVGAAHASQSRGYR
jgi:phthalate 4,5-cis-dihydrodiol dehydrogenase